MNNIDYGDGTIRSQGMFPQRDGTFLVMTFSVSRYLKTENGAIAWLAKRGLDKNGDNL